LKFGKEKAVAVFPTKNSPQAKRSGGYFRICLRPWPRLLVYASDRGLTSG